MPSDIEISKAADLWPIKKIAEKSGFAEEDLVYYGPYKAKISEKAVKDKKGKNGKLILVTA
ncbi:MAG: formate--tetrahydrofolate ligase, partial [Clostridia bacterium]|nr:formate--tetrahydrofolate ligase [Clostridia bacterium]